MDYNKIKNRIFYSKELKTAHGKESPVKGYGSAGGYAREVQRCVETVAVVNGLNRDYCSVLALTKYLGIPPYGIEGEIAIKELLGSAYDKTKISLEKLANIAEESPNEQLKKDLTDLNNNIDDDHLSNEAKLVAFVEDALKSYSLLTPEEQEKLGGSILENTMINGIHKDENGILQRSEWQEKISKVVANREKRPDGERVSEIKNKIKDTIINATRDEQSVIENILE